MADFFQPGVITTLRRLKKVNLERMAKDFLERLHKREVRRGEGPDHISDN